MHFLNVVQESKDGQNQQQKRERQNPEKKKDEEPSFHASLKNLENAVETFQSDAQTQAHGLSASVEGKGPGLRVVLKDGSGATLRQFTGEEFLRLREAAGNNSPARGKILDQKF